MRAVMTDLWLTFWHLLPANPIVLRVIAMGGKRVQHLVIRTVYLAALLGVMGILQMGMDSGSGSLAALARSSSRVFVYISFFQLAMIALVAPVFTAGAISQEKDAETFDVLLTTPLSNAQIVLGSLASRLFFVIALLISGLPIFCITMLFGGVTSREIFLSFGIAGCTAVLTGSLAILISVCKVGTRGTIFSFYAGIALYLAAGLGLGLLPWTHVPETVPPGGSAGMTWMTLAHPFWALAAALSQCPTPSFAEVARYPWPLDRMLPEPHLGYMVLTLGVSAVMIAWSALCVRGGARQGEPGRLRRLLGRRARGAGGAARRPRRVWSNPVAWREAMTRGSVAGGTLAWYGYLGLATLACLWLLYANLTSAFPGGSQARDWLTVIVLVEFVMVLLMAANTAATAITREREAGTIELLLTTPLTSEEIVRGKLRGLVSFTLPLLAAPAATVLVMALADFALARKTPAAWPEAVLVVPFLMLVYAAFACMLGLHMSLKCRTSVQAVLAAVGLLVALAFGLGLCALGVFGGGPELAGLLGPLTFVTSIYLALNPEHLHAGSGFAGVGAAGNIVATRTVIVVGTVIAAGLYAAIAIGVYRTIIRNFDFVIRKQSS